MSKKENWKHLSRKTFNSPTSFKITLEKDELNKLKRLAYPAGITVSDLIRTAIKHLTENYWD